jgi:oligoendopeptidase F
MMIGLSMFFAEGDVGSQTRDRSQVAEKDTWRLEDLYESEDLWRASKEKVVKELDNVLQYKGKLTTSADSLLSCLNLGSELSKEF